MTNIIKFPGNISHTNYPTTSTYWIRNAFQPKKRKKKKKDTHTHIHTRFNQTTPRTTFVNTPNSARIVAEIVARIHHPSTIIIIPRFHLHREILRSNVERLRHVGANRWPFLPPPPSPFNDVRNDRQLESQADCLRTTKERGICLTCRLKACRRNEYHSAFLMTCFARLFIWLKRERSRELSVGSRAQGKGWKLDPDTEEN